MSVLSTFAPPILAAFALFDTYMWCWWCLALIKTGIRERTTRIFFALWLASGVCLYFAVNALFDQHYAKSLALLCCTLYWVH